MLRGILDLPEEPSSIGVVIVVGGPQYKVGSHRQFTLLARALATSGFATLRFDHRGIGDSDGDPVSFECLDSDICAAIDQLVSKVDAVKEVAIWGLCDAASAAMMYASNDARVTSLILLNPWIRSEQGLAKTYVRQYYWSRLISLHFWRNLLGGKFDVSRAVRDFAKNVRIAMNRMPTQERRQANSSIPASAPFQSRMLSGMQSYRGQALFILSGEDITAAEFDANLSSNHAWRRIARDKSFEIRRIANANHTFSRAAWRDQVASWTISWLRAQ